LKVRTGYAAGTERTWRYSVEISLSDVQAPPASQPVESTPRIRSYGQKPAGRQYDRY
jgi:hypothetical protein